MHIFLPEQNLATNTKYFVTIFYLYSYRQLSCELNSPGFFWNLAAFQILWKKNINSNVYMKWKVSLIWWAPLTITTMAILVPVTAMILVTTTNWHFLLFKCLSINFDGNFFWRQLSILKINAEGGIWTLTPARTLRPEHSVSTSSTTSALSQVPNIIGYRFSATVF